MCTQDIMVKNPDYVELGLVCADVCGTLHCGMIRRRSNGLSRAVCEAIEQLTRYVQSMIYIIRVSFTAHLIVELWQKSRGRSPGRGGGIRSASFSTR